jgi:uncharacterized OB-fold protein
MMAELHPNAEYQEFLKRGQFVIQRSQSSGRHYFYPRVMEPGTGKDDLQWVSAAGTGTVYSVTVVRTRPPAEPYNVVLVDLDEGPRMMSRVEGIAAEAVEIGMRVRARIEQENDLYFIVFDPA